MSGGMGRKARSLAQAPVYCDTAAEYSSSLFEVAGSELEKPGQYGSLRLRAPGARSNAFSSGACNNVSKPDQGLSSKFSILDQIRRWLPASKLAKNNDRRSAKFEHGLFVAS
jgi:hypothetical protein